MKQTRKEPQAPRLPLKLDPAVLTSALAAQEKLNGLEINDDLWPKEKAPGREFSECRLTKVTMAAISEKNYFIDVIFDHCDFSNCQLSESTLRRVVFDHCRMTGADLSRCVLQDVVFLNCALDYSNFAFSSFKSCRFADCICSQSSSAKESFPALKFNAASWMKVSFSTVISAASICPPVRSKELPCAATS